MSSVLHVWKRLPRALVLYSLILSYVPFLVPICKADENSSISLDISTFKVSENLPERSLVGSLAVVGIESNQSAEFKIIEESDQNMSSIFSMDKNGSIYTSSSLDYETIPLYLLRVQIQVEDQLLSEEIIIEIEDKPEITDIVLSKNYIFENQGQSKVIGYFSVLADTSLGSEEPLIQIHEGSDYFEIKNDELISIIDFDFERENMFDIQVSVEMNGFESFDKNFSIEIRDVPENLPPKGLDFFTLGIKENLPAGSFIGTLRGVDDDALSDLSYTLVDFNKTMGIILSKDGSVTSSRAFDYEMNKEIEFKATVIDYQDQNFTEIFRFSIIDDPNDNTSIENNASGSISGRVVDSNGTLVPTFEICVYDANHTDAFPPLLFSQYFDSNGSFEVLVEPGIYFLEIRGAHRSTNSNQTQSFLSSFFDDGNSSVDNYGSKIILSNDHLKYSRANWELEEIDFDLIDNSTDTVQVEGHVNGHGSVGLSGVVIEVRLNDNPLDPPLKRVVSDENGYYQISMPPGPWYFRAVDHTGFWSSQSLFRNLIFGIDEIGENSLDFDLQEENLIEVSGQIVTLQGDPVRNARVLFNEQTTGAVFSLSHYGQFDSENGGFSCFLPKGKYLIEAIDPEGLHTSSWYGGIDSKSAKVVSSSEDDLILVMGKMPSVFLDIEFDFDANRTYASPPLLEIRRFPDENTSHIEVNSFFPPSITNKGKQQVQYEVPKGIVELLLHIDPPVDPYINNSVISSPSASRWIYDLNESSWTQQSDSQKEKSVYRIDLNQDLDLGTIDLKEIFREFPNESNKTSEQMDLSKSLSSVRGVVTVGSGVAAGALIIARNSEIGLSREVRADFKGEFEVKNLSNGTWHIHAQSPTTENNLLYADSEVEEIILTEASDLEINFKILEANVIGKSVLSDLDGVLSTPVSGICWVTSLETDSDDNSSDATPFSSSLSREFSVDFDESGMFALRLEQGKFNIMLEVSSHTGSTSRRTFHVEIININKPIFLGDQRKLSWEEIQGVSEYVVQREVHFANHFETIEVVDEPLSLVPSLNKSFANDDTFRVLAKGIDGTTVIDNRDLEQAIPVLIFPLIENFIVGKVEDIRGQPVSAIEVLAFDYWKGGVIRTRTDDQGDYKLSVSTGDWVVRLGSHLESDYQYQQREYDFSNEFLISFDDDDNGAVKNVNFSLLPFQSSNIKIEGRFENLSDRSLTDLKGYEARVRLVGENSIYEAKVSSDGLFSLEVEEGSYQIYPWIDSTSGFFPDWNSSDYYEIGEPYGVLEVNATDTVQANTVILVNKATSIISGQVLDFDGVAIPDAIITAVSDVGDILITESNLFGMFDFKVRGDAFWTVSCHFWDSSGRVKSPYEAPADQSFLLKFDEDRKLEFRVRRFTHSIDGKIREGSLDPDNFFQQTAFLKRIDLWGNEEILDLAEIDSRGEFTFQLAGVTDLLSDLEPELQTGVLSDWSGDFPIVLGEQIESNPFGEDQFKYTLDPFFQTPLNEVTGRLIFSENEARTGWEGVVYALSLDQQSEIRTIKIKEDGSFIFKLPPGTWVFDYEITSVDNQTRGFDASPPKSYEAEISSDHTLDPFILHTYKIQNASLMGRLVDDSNRSLEGLFRVEIRGHRENQTLDGSLSSKILEVNDGSFSHTFVLNGLYEIWVFPSTELRAKGYAMPSPKSVLVSGAQTGVTEVDIVIPWFDPELSLNSFLEGRILGLDGLPIVFDPQYQGSTPLITITSATGLFAWTYADMEGKFVFDEIPSGQDWYVGGSFFDLATGKDLSTLKDSGPYLSGDYEIMIQLEDFSGANPMPEKQTRVFDRRKNFQVSLSDGMEVLIPAGAIPINDGTPMAQITVTPQSERLHRDLSRVPVGYGYDIVVTDMKGQIIQGPFLKEVKMTIPLNPFFLDAMDMDVNDVFASSYDHKFNSWVSPNAMVVASEQNKIHVMTDHFSTWAPTARAETHVPMPVPLGVSSHATSNVNWYEHEWFGVFYSRPDDEWIFHATHGLLYVDQQSSTDNGIWFWDDTFEAWLWVQKESYRAGKSHFFYHADWESWIWHIADSLNPRTFYDYDRAGWFTDEMAFSVYLTSNNNSFGTVSGSGMYDKGETVQFSAKPNYGYAFSGWSGDLFSSETTIEIPSVYRVSNLHANFYKIPESLLSIDFTGSGSGEVKGSGNYEYGETVTLRAEAGYSSVFFGWLENGSKISWNEEIELLMEGNRKIEAQFEPATIENILKAKYASNP